MSLYAIVLPPDGGEEDFRATAKRCIGAGLPPEAVVFVTEGSLLPAPPSAGSEPRLTVPRGYAELLRDAVCHRAPDRFTLLYQVLWRIEHGERDLVTRAADPAVATLEGYARAVRRDIHKMHAFVRFRAVEEENGHQLYVAWFEPRHYILERAVTFFVERFTAMDWLIATPIGTAVWQNRTLTIGPAVERPPEGQDSVLDDLWLAYYRTTFNPARLRTKAMAAEMPRQYWGAMRETRLIRGMVKEAGARVAAMDSHPADVAPLFAERIAARKRADRDVPATALTELKAEAARCERCPLHAPATQTVFGEGPSDATIVFVGEQPGDHEDLTGRPFVGPAGEVFDRALAEAGIDRRLVYVTNAVKHFKYEPRGKKRIHQKPNAGEIAHCRWWLERELALLEPKLVVALGATAAHSLSGRPVSVMKARGPARFGPQAGYITVHPSFLLRLPDERAKREEYARFVADLNRIKTVSEMPAAV